METSADFVSEVCFVILVPPIITVFVVIWVVYWMAMAVLVYANGSFSSAGD
jgi:hypothetical protein